MKSLWITAGACLVCGTIAFAAETVREFSWSDLKNEGKLKTGVRVPRGGQNTFESLLVENREAGPLVAEILATDSPGVTAPVWAFRGRIRYEAVEGNGYIEMWNHFADGSRYFSRTLAPHGPMASLHGSSGWREFAVPFFATGTDKRPSRLVINVAFPGKGRVWLGPLELRQYGPGEDRLTASGAWWSDRQGGLIGGVGGSMLGLLGAFVGILCSQGRARPVVLGLMSAAVFVGLSAAVLGLFAVLRAQPYDVYYPLFLGGGLCVGIFGALMPIVRRRYAQIELRRMRSLDLGR